MREMIIMPRPCTVCTHVKRKEIEGALEARERLRDIAARYEVSLAALSRHKAHMAQEEGGQDKVNLVVLACPSCGEAEIYFNGWQDDNTVIIYCPWCKNQGFIRNLAVSEVEAGLEFLHLVSKGKSKPPAWETEKKTKRGGKVTEK
jgi:hypothetical protein